MVESAYVRGAKITRHAEIVADANDCKANSGHPLDTVRRAERDALAELAGEYDDPADVEAIELPSERLGKEPSPDSDSESDPDTGADDENEDESE